MKWSRLFNRMLEEKSNRMLEEKSKEVKKLVVHGSHWTADEIEFLKRNRHLTAREIAEKLNRTVEAVRTKRQRLRIRPSYFWTEEEEEKLRELYEKGLSDKEIAKLIGRPAGAIRSKRRRMGLVRRRRA